MTLNSGFEVQFLTSLKFQGAIIERKSSNECLAFRALQLKQNFEKFHSYLEKCYSFKKLRFLVPVGANYSLLEKIVKWT